MVNSSPGRGQRRLGIALASLKHRQSLVQKESERTMPLLSCPDYPSLLFLWKQRGILHRCGSPRRFPQLLSHLSQVVGGVVSKGEPGSDLSDADMTDSEAGRSQAFVVGWRYLLYD